MNQLINNLRLSIAQLNNFLIKNYLIEPNENANQEPYLYLYSIFRKLIGGLGECGSYLNEINHSVNDVSIYALQKDLINESIKVIYLIEKSNNKEDLLKIIRSLNSYSLQLNLNNIIAYAEQHKTDTTSVENEIKDLKIDNPDYFDAFGQLKFTPLNPSVEAAAEYIIKHVSTINHKIIIKKVTDLSTTRKIVSPYEKQDQKYLDRLRYDVVNSIYIILLAITYIEPFFEKDGPTCDLFTEMITNTFKMHKELIKNTSF